MNQDRSGLCEVKESNNDCERCSCKGSENELEWDQIKTIPLIDLSADRSFCQLEETKQTEFVTVQEVVHYFNTVDITDQLPKIKPRIEKSWLRTCLSRLFCLSPKALETCLIDERNRIFSVALLSFDNQDSWQSRFLFTIYKKLTGCFALECHRFGNHWQRIGFQGTDPATDLRGVGLLGLIQLLFLILSPETEQLAKAIYKLSLDENQHFPFAAMSTNLTQISLQILREGLLNQPSNQAKSVFKVFNSFYSGIFFKLFRIWKEESKTIIDTGFVLKDLKLMARKDVKSILNGINNFSNDFESKSQDQNEVEFTYLGEMFANLDEFDE